jgi:hypothetical protein
MTHRARPTPHRPSRPPCPSSADDPASRRSDVGGCDHHRPVRDLPPRGAAGGSHRWAIHWAKLRRIGPYQLHRRALTAATIWRFDDLGRFAGISLTGRPANAMLHTERTLVRNQSRPSSSDNMPSGTPRLPGAVGERRQSGSIRALAFVGSRKSMNRSCGVGSSHRFSSVTIGVVISQQTTSWRSERERFCAGGRSHGARSHP